MVKVLELEWADEHCMTAESQNGADQESDYVGLALTFEIYLPDLSFRQHKSQECYQTASEAGTAQLWCHRLTDITTNVSQEGFD